MALRTWRIIFTHLSGPSGYIPPKGTWSCEMTAPTKDGAIYTAQNIARLTAGAYQEGSVWNVSAIPVLWGEKKGEMIQ